MLAGSTLWKIDSINHFIWCSMPALYQAPRRWRLAAVIQCEYFGPMRLCISSMIQVAIWLVEHAAFCIASSPWNGRPARLQQLSSIKAYGLVMLLETT